MASSQNRLVYQSGKLFLQDSERSNEFEVNIIGDLLVTGNLSVLGDADQVNIREQTLQVTDTQIFLNYGEPRVGDEIINEVDGNIYTKRTGILVDRGLFRKSVDTPGDRAIAAFIFPDVTVVSQADPDDGTIRLYDNDTGQMLLLPKDPADRSQPAALSWIDRKHAWSFESTEFPTDLDGSGSPQDYPGDLWVAPRLIEIGNPQLPNDAEIPVDTPIDPLLKQSDVRTTLIDTSTDHINIEHPDYDGTDERLIYASNIFARTAVNVDFLNKYAQEVTSVFDELKAYTAYTATNKAQDYVLQYNATTGYFEHRPLEIHYDTTPTLGGHLDTAGFRVDYNTTDYMQTFGTNGINVNLDAGHSLVLSTNASVESNTGLDFNLSSNDGDINLVANSTGTANGDILIETSNAGQITLKDTTKVNVESPELSLTGQLSINGYGFKSPSAGTPVIYQMPPTDGAVGQVLLTDGAGNLSFSNLSLEASKWENARTITLAGDTTGSVTIDGSANATLAVTVLNDSHTHTSAFITDATPANTANMIVKRDASGNFSAGTITANLTGIALNSTNANLTAANTTNATHYLPFSSTATGYQPLKTDTDLSYNPSTNTLSAVNFSGQATASNTVLLTARNASTVTHYLPFSAGTTGNQSVYSDTGLTYIPSTNTIVAANYDGTARTTTNINVITNTGSSVNRYITFADATTGEQPIQTDGQLSYNPSTNTLNAVNFNGQALNATNVTVVDTSTTAGSYYPAFVSTSGNTPVRVDTDMTYNPGTNTLTVENIVGTVTDADAVNLVAADTATGSHYLTFAAGATDTQAINTDTGLTYVPSTNTLTATNFAGQATNATNINILTSSAATGTQYLTFTTASSGNTRPRSDVDLIYTPSTNTITCANFEGQALNATNVNLTELETSASNHYLVFSAASSGNTPLYTDSGVLYNPTENTISAAAFNGQATNATNTTITANATNANQYITFVSGTSGNLPQRVDAGIVYNPSTNTLTVPNISGNISSATKLATARTISLTGDVSGSTTFDGTANASITAVVANNSHTHTSANISDATSANTANMIVKRDASGNFSAGTITASLSGTATNATNVTITALETSLSEHYLPFVSATFGNLALYADTGIKYVPSSNTLFADNFDGLATNATLAATSTTVNAVATNTTNSEHYIGFLTGASGSQVVRTDSTLTYNPSTDTLTVGNIAGNISTATALATARTISLSGDASGSVSFDGTANVAIPVVVANNSHTHTSANISDATNANTANMIVKRDASGNFGAGTITASLSGNATSASTTNITADATNANQYLTFVSGTSGNLGHRVDGGLLYNPSTNTLTVTNITGTITNATSAVNATNATNVNLLADDTSATDHYILFSTSSTAGNNRVKTGSKLKFNPSSGQLSGVTISGNAGSATKLATARTISLTGDVSGSTSFDGSANVSITAVVANNSHTHTSANISDATNANTANMIVKRDASGNFSAGTITATLAGSAASLTTARTINGTSFNGTANITTANWGTARNITIGNTTKSVNGSANVSWSTSEIGVMRASSTSNTDANQFIQSGVRYEPNANNPTNSYYAGLTYGNGGNVTGQLFTHFQTGETYTRGYNTSWTAWRKQLDDTNYTSYVPTLTGTGASGTWGISITGNAASATKLATARTINGTSFNGTANITTANWGTARSITVGDTTKSVNGSANVAWTLSEIGAIPLAGSSAITGNLSTTGTQIEVGRGSGSVALTTNDGYGNANLTFNHKAGTPDVNGNSARISVNTDSTSNASIGFQVGSGTTSGSAVGLTTVLTLSGSASTFTTQVNATSFNATSSRRYKSDITDTDLEFANGVLALRPVRYVMDSTGKEEFGFIAEEVNELYPEVVPKNENGEAEAVDYSRLVAPLTAKVQMQEEEILNLKAELAEMKEMLSQLLKK